MSLHERDLRAPSEEIDLIALGRVLWGRRRLILAVSLCFAIVGVLIALLSKPMYTAEVAVTAVSDDAMGAAESLMSQFGGLASIVGVDINSGGASQQAVATLHSRRLVEEFVKRYVPPSELEPHAKKDLTLWMSVKRFRENVVKIDSDDEGVFAISITWTDPDKAARWANDFVALANEIIRVRAIEEANRNVEYLNAQLVRTEVLELRRVIYSLIESQMKQLMLANGRIEYAFVTVDPAVAPEIRRSPKRTLIVLASGMLGFLVGIGWAFIVDLVSRHRKAVAA